MDLLSVQTDRREQMLASGLDSWQAEELREWFCYTKTMGEDMKVVARTSPEGDRIFCVHTAGTGSQNP